jgi:hypothetical protein
MNPHTPISVDDVHSILLIVLLGYIPSFFLFYSAWRINKKKEFTAISPNYSRQSWRKPVTFKKKDTKSFVTTYLYIGGLWFLISTTILLSIIIP